MPNRPWIVLSGWLLATLAAACLMACGSSGGSPEVAGLSGAPPHPKPKRQVPIGDTASADMTSAVTLAKSSSAAPVQLKFELEGQPQPGQPLEVSFALIPVDPGIVQLSMKFQGDSGLEVVTGVEMPQVDKPAQGVPIRHSVSVLPKADGVYVLTAAVTSDTENDSRTMLFTVPVISGTGLPELAARKGSAANATPVTTR